MASNSNPLIAQGSLNRLIGSVNVPASPALNITAPYLGKEAIHLALEGDAVTFISTMTGMVTSPEPYMPATITAHLLKTQGLALAWKSRLVQNPLIGNVVVYPDTTTLLPFDISNCGILRVEPLSFTGEDAGFVVEIRGIYYISNTLWSMFTETAA